MKTISRRELNQHSGRILDEVLATGEPIAVTTRGARTVVIAPAAPTRYDEWVRLGVVTPASEALDAAPRATSPRSVDDMLAAIEQHIKSVDALHLATCEFVGARLATFDETMRSVARARGIDLAV